MRNGCRIVMTRRTALRFRHVPRDVQGEAAFLTDEHLPDTGAERVIPLEGDPRGAAAHCSKRRVPFGLRCSTLVARMFDAPGYSMGLVEPVAEKAYTKSLRRRARKRSLRRSTSPSCVIAGRGQTRISSTRSRLPSWVCARMRMRSCCMRRSALPRLDRGIYAAGAGNDRPDAGWRSGAAICAR